MDVRQVMQLIEFPACWAEYKQLKDEVCLDVCMCANGRGVLAQGKFPGNQAERALTRAGQSVGGGGAGTDGFCPSNLCPGPRIVAHADGERESGRHLVTGPAPQALLALECE